MSSLQIDTENFPEVKETEELVKEIVSEEKRPTDVAETEVDALSNNKVGVEIEPDVKANRVSVQICSCSLIFNCFSPNR